MMNPVAFEKYHGTGNDFIIVDNRNMHFDHSALNISLLCDRRFGIGADGLILLENLNGYDFSMKYFNSDGKESTMCGNGGRCIVAFAASKGIITSLANFMAMDGTHQALLGEVNQGNWHVKLQMNNVTGMIISGNHYELNTGSPHYVSFSDNPDDHDFVNSARKIRYSEAYAAEGINVNFARWEDEMLFVRTYERGVEDETLSCGTGVTASAMAAALKNGGKGQSEIKVITKGGKLKVSFHYDGEMFSDVWLEGPASFVYSGEINIRQNS